MSLSHAAGRIPIVCGGAVVLPSHYVVALLSLSALVSAQILYSVEIDAYLDHRQLVVDGVLLGVTVGLFAATSCVDPGVVNRYRQPTLDLTSTVYLKFCRTCQIWRPLRSKHCRRCDNCIDVFDHHCLFLGCCIGRRNRRSFILFLMSLSLLVLADAVAGLLYETFLYLDLLQSGQGLRLLFHLQHRGRSTLVMLIILVWLWLAYLTLWHLCLAGRGMTTAEYLKGVYEEVPNPYDRGWIRNLWHLFRDPIPPSQL